MSVSRRELSVAILARNEESTIAEAIASVTGIANEIVVVDTGSFDKTREIARASGARVVDHPWTDSFSAARNAGMSAVAGDFVLWLDASETIVPESAATLQAYLATASGKKAHLAIVELPPVIEGAARQRSARPRLLPVRGGFWFEGRVRERLHHREHGPNIPIELSPIRIRRSDREHDISVRVAKAQRDLTLLASEIEERGRLPHVINALGECFQTLGDRKTARACFREAITTAAEGTTDQLVGYEGLLTTYDGNPSEREEQVAVGLESLKIFPRDAQLLCAMGGYLQNIGRFDLARRSFEVAADFGQVDVTSWHVENIRDLARDCLKRLDIAEAEQKRAAESSSEPSGQPREIMVDSATVPEPSEAMRRRLSESTSPADSSAAKR